MIDNILHLIFYKQYFRFEDAVRNNSIIVMPIYYFNLNLTN